ncbi:hypothetical protein PPTG_24966, partial [Phytophthora nicotianae INRA-310]
LYYKPSKAPRTSGRENMSVKLMDENENLSESVLRVFQQIHTQLQRIGTLGDVADERASVVHVGEQAPVASKCSRGCLPEKDGEIPPLSPDKPERP